MKAKPIKLSVKKAITRLEHTLNDASFPASLAYPPYEPQEIDEARFTAVELLKQMSTPKADEDAERAARRRALVSIFMFQMTVGGIVEFMKKLKGKPLVDNQELPINGLTAQKEENERSSGETTGNDQ